MDERRSRLRADQTNREPDTDAADCAEDQRKQRKENGVTAAVLEQRRIVLPPRKALGYDQEEASTHRKMRDENVQHRDQRNQHTAGNRELPVWVVQGSDSWPNRMNSSVSSTGAASNAISKSRMNPIPFQGLRLKLNCSFR